MISELWKEYYEGVNEFSFILNFFKTTSYSILFYYLAKVYMYILYDLWIDYVVNNFGWFKKHMNFIGQLSR